MTKQEKVLASSFQRYNGGVKTKRRWGSSTITRFYVMWESDKHNASAWEIIEGFGPTPGERKTYAIGKFLEKRGLTRNPAELFLRGKEGDDARRFHGETRIHWQSKTGEWKSKTVSSPKSAIELAKEMQAKGRSCVVTRGETTLATFEATKRNPSPNHGQDPHVLTYGVMPPLSHFREHLKGYTSEGEARSITDADSPVFYMDLVGADAEVAHHAAEAVPGVHMRHGRKMHVSFDDVASLHGFLVSLAHHLDDGNEAAGDLASSMLTSLGYEWI